MEFRSEIALNVGDDRKCLAVVIFEDKQPEGNDSFLISVEELGLTHVIILDDDG